MGKLIDLTGQRFGRLTVLGRAGIYRAPDQETICLTWRCRCDCGNETVVIGNNLKHGYTKSCGCLRKEIASERMRAYHDKRQRTANAVL